MKGKCLGHWDDNYYGREFNCEHKYADMICEDCIFGACNGTLDPRTKSHRYIKKIRLNRHKFLYKKG